MKGRDNSILDNSNQNMSFAFNNSIIEKSQEPNNSLIMGKSRMESGDLQDMSFKMAEPEPQP